MPMSVRQKAIEIFDKMFDEIPQNSRGNLSVEVAKQCSLIALENVLYALSLPPINNKGHMLYDSQIEYWNMVKEEIEKL